MGQRNSKTATITEATVVEDTTDKTLKPKPINRKALLIGINYIDTEFALDGCINDVANIKKFLTTEYKLEETNIRMLTDKTDIKPTKANILEALAWLAQGADSTTKLFLHYSGHGTSLRDISNEESDGLDECVCPLDYETNGFITDDVMRRTLIDKLPTGCNLFSIFDCCHSGTILDLKYNYRFDSVPERTEYRLTLQRNTKVTKATVTLLSGCLDHQTSADAFIESSPQGAMTHSFLKAYETLKKNNKDITCKQLMKTLNTCISRFTQKPKVSTGRSTDLNQKIIIF